MNTGLNSYNATTSTDIRGETRIQDGTIDMGAYEWTSGVDPDPLHIYVNASASGSNNGTSWTNAYTSLQSALTAAVSNDQIWVAKGTYKPTTDTDRTKSFQMKNGVTIYGGFAGTETASSQRTNYGVGDANETILSGDIGTVGATTDNCYHVIYNPDLTTDINNSAILDGFTIKGGNADGASPHNSGSGVYNASSSPTLTNVTITSNSASSSGGGIYNSSSSPTLTNVIIGNNSADWGGGIFNDASSPTLTNVTIGNNSATGTYGYGGGMINSSSSPTLKNCIIWGNTASATTNPGKQFYISGGTTTLNYSCYANGTNDVYNSGGTFTATDHNITNNPQFLDASNCDYRLYGSSYCVNTGYNTYNTTSTDIRGKDRIQNTTIDRGAYEWTSGTDPALSSKTIYVNALATGLNDGSSWANAFTSLQDALDLAGSSDQIWVKAGTYKPSSAYSLTDGSRFYHFEMKVGAAIYGGFAGTETATNQRIHYGVGEANETILSGDVGTIDDDSDNCYHVLYHPDGSGLTSSAILDGFTISDGYATGPSPHYYGGGMYNVSSSPTLANCTFTSNSALANGGGMYNISSSPTLTNCTFTSNSVSSSSASTSGGGMYNESSSPALTNCTFTSNLVSSSSSANGSGMYNTSSSPTLTNCTFTSNSATSSSSANGGGMYNYTSSSPTLDNCTFSSNSAKTGGGMCNTASSPTLDNCTFSSNSATLGGGMYNGGSASSPQLNNCTFTSNSATSGSGMYNGESSPSLDSCTFTSNSVSSSTSSTYGGGMYNTSSSPTLTYCTFTSNTATSTNSSYGGYGGGMYNITSSSPTITHSTFETNSATATGSIGGLGGGMFNSSSSPTLNNCIFTTNSVSASQAKGGGMYNADSSPSLDSCSFSSNSTNYGGGGMFNGGNSAPALTHCTFTSNTAASFGGGMFNQWTSSYHPTLENCTFASNEATNGYGGGIYNDSSSPTLTNVTISNNSAHINGGGMYNTTYNASCTPTLTNVTIINNSAVEGGGMYNFSNVYPYYSSPVLTNLTISSNSATSGGGMYNKDYSSPTLKNCIVWGNTATVLGKQFYIYGSGTTTLNYSCYANGTNDVSVNSSTFTATNNNISSNPQFVGSSNNATHPYSIGGISPCADAGDDSYCFESTDIRGGSFGRKLNKVTGETGTIDMGAYEYKFDSDASLPVELTAFTAESQNGGVVLKWSTESEIENMGFIIDKRLQVTGDWLQVAGYLTDKALEGHGSTSAKHEYQFTDKAVQPGVTYLYRLADVDYSGKVTWHKEVEVKVEAESAQIPAKFGLHAAYPNPFNPALTLSFGLSEDGQTALKVYNMRGQLVEVLISTYTLKGTYSLTWQPRNLSTGVYIVRLESGKETNLQKVVFVK